MGKGTGPEGRGAAERRPADRAVQSLTGLRPTSAFASLRRDESARQASKVQSPPDRRPAAVERLESFLAAWLVLALLATGCAGGPRPLKGGKAVTTRKPGAVIEQTLVQGENPSQGSKQAQETVKVRTYTVPAGSRIEQSQVWEGERHSS